jgi:hypothetical protein
MSAGRSRWIVGARGRVMGVKQSRLEKRFVWREEGKRKGFELRVLRPEEQLCFCG